MAAILLFVPLHLYRGAGESSWKCDHLWIQPSPETASHNLDWPNGTIPFGSALWNWSCIIAKFCTWTETLLTTQIMITAALFQHSICIRLWRARWVISNYLFKSVVWSFGYFLSRILINGTYPMTLSWWYAHHLLYQQAYTNNRVDAKPIDFFCIIYLDVFLHWNSKSPHV